MLAGLLLRFCLGVALTLALAGAAMAWTSRNAVKRVVGAVLALFGAALALVGLGLRDAAMAGLAAALAVLIVGAALLVRVQEAYGGVEIADLEAADAAEEPRA